VDAARVKTLGLGYDKNASKQSIDALNSLQSMKDKYTKKSA